MSLKKIPVFLISILLVWAIASCGAGRHAKAGRDLSAVLEGEGFENHFTGFLLYDPLGGDTLLRHQSAKYFTPASNVKIFTLFSCLQLLPENIPSLKYWFAQDTLYVQGTGDPAFLHPHFRDSTALKFMASAPHIVLNILPGMDTPYAPGWAWEDFDGAYATERSAFPLYGNQVEIFHDDSLVVRPDYFRDRVLPFNFTSNREREENLFFYGKERTDTLLVPFRTDSTLSRELLQNALGKPIGLKSIARPESVKILYGIRTDSLYRRMMQESDNFLAEQLLLTASSTLSDTLDSRRVMDKILREQLAGLRQPPRWIDGSGLSRYNLFSPESMVYVLTKLYREVPHERLFHYFAAGGESGTLKTWLRGDPHPYIFAKTGTLGNQFCLSGYLKTRSGKILIFSMMNSNFRIPLPLLKARIQRILEEIRDRY